jgi:hypothetical protein
MDVLANVGLLSFSQAAVKLIPILSHIISCNNLSSELWFVRFPGAKSLPWDFFTWIVILHEEQNK